MSPAESVIDWLGRLQAGDAEAAQRIWERYFRRLVGLARKKLRGRHRRAADEEDVALSAFASFCRGARQGRFPRLADGDDLWRLLVVLTARKAHNHARHEGRQKRGGNAVVGESAAPDLEQVVDGQPTPAFAAQVAEECRRLLTALPAAELRSVAQWKMEGYTSGEIAARLGCVERSVERKLQVIRTVWEGSV